MYITAKIIKVGAFNRSFTLDTNEDHTVRKLFEIAEEEFKEEEVSRNQGKHGNVYLNDTVHEGDKFVIAPAVKGNTDQFAVKLMVVGDENFELTVSNGETIKDLIKRLDEAKSAKFFTPEGKSAFSISELKTGTKLEINDKVPRPGVGEDLVKILFSVKTKGNK